MAYLQLYSVFSICILYYLTLAQAAKIIGLPYIGRSQYIGMRCIAEELTKRNHQVTLIVNSAQKIQLSENLKHAIHRVPFEEDFYEKVMVKSILKGGIQDMLFGSLTKMQELSCESLLKDTKLLDSFKDYDLIITDISNFCGPIVADYLGIRRVEYWPGAPREPALMPFSYDAFLSLSYIPQFFSENPMRMNFLQRVQNTITFWVSNVINTYVMTRKIQALKIKYNIKPDRSLNEAMNDKELTLFLADFAFEYAQPLRPDYKLIGPVTIQPVSPLPHDLQQLIDSSGDDGVIIVSFGSNVASILDKEKVDIMAEAFGRLKQKVIWRLQGYIPSSLSPNIKPVDWLPQNDFLAHEKLRVFVTHCGLNSVYETLYRGVPVVAIPLFMEQPDNAIHMEGKGVALIVEYKTLTVNHLYNTIQRVINEPSFRENAQRISRLMQDRPRTPVQEAGDWIEYTLRHDSLAHLRPYSDHLAWYQYFLVDVAVFLVLVIMVVIMVIKYTFQLVRWVLCRRARKQKTQ